MITLAASLSAMLKSNHRIPAISLEATQSRNELPIMSWSRWYTGSETDSPHAACVSADGSLIRVRNESGTIQVSRVTTPSSGDTWNSWTSLGAIAAAGGGVAVAADNAGNVCIVFVKTGGLRITFRSSSNNGASFGGSGDITTSNESAAVSWCAIACNSSNTFMVWWNRGNTDLRRVTTAAAAGSWAVAFTTASLSATIASFAGMAADFGTDYELVIAGTKATSNDLCVIAATFGFGNKLAAGTLGTWRDLQTADASSTITFHRCHLRRCRPRHLVRKGDRRRPVHTQLFRDRRTRRRRERLVH